MIYVYQRKKPDSEKWADVLTKSRLGRIVKVFRRMKNIHTTFDHRVIGYEVIVQEKASKI